MRDSIINKLGTDKEVDKFYVYALCNKETHIPFYIGKGQGNRMWEHKEGYEKEKERIETLKIKPEEKDVALSDLSEKHKKIKELGDNVEEIIIKWGLTENEAFMAESALINLLNYPKKTLTNIANGHSSQKEKANGKTEVMNESSFLKICQLPKIIERDFSTNCIFIAINKLYPTCLDEPENNRQHAIKETARGCWQIGKTKHPEYLFAMYHSRICGIYKITEIKKLKDIKNVDELNFFPDFPVKIRTAEKKFIEKILKNGIPDTFNELNAEHQNSFIDLANNYITGVKDHLQKGIEVNYCEEYKKWYDRSFFICDDCEEYKNDLDRIVKKEDGNPIFGRNPISYGKSTN